MYIHFGLVQEMGDSALCIHQARLRVQLVPVPKAKELWKMLLQPEGSTISSASTSLAGSWWPTQPLCDQEMQFYSYQKVERSKLPLKRYESSFTFILDNGLNCLKYQYVLLGQMIIGCNIIDYKIFHRKNVTVDIFVLLYTYIHAYIHKKSHNLSARASLSSSLFLKLFLTIPECLEHNVQNLFQDC